MLICADNIGNIIQCYLLGHPCAHIFYLIQNARSKRMEAEHWTVCWDKCIHFQLTYLSVYATVKSTSFCEVNYWLSMLLSGSWCVLSSMQNWLILHVSCFIAREIVKWPYNKHCISTPGNDQEKHIWILENNKSMWQVVKFVTSHKWN